MEDGAGGSNGLGAAAGSSPAEEGHTAPLSQWGSLSVLPDPWKAEQQQQQQQQQQEEEEHADAALTGQLQDAVLCSVLGVGLELLRDGSQQVRTQGARVGARAE